jgi:hypothetical protein
MTGKFIIAMLLSMLAVSTTTFGNWESNCPPFCQPCVQQPRPKTFVTQIGATFEERPAYINAYAFLNQVIKGKYFYELRAYYFHNLIVTNTLSHTPVTPISKEKNVDGGGGLVILGYMFHLGPKVFLEPFTRWQCYTNTVAAYKDVLGNRLETVNITGYLGLRFQGIVNESLSLYAQYFGGYQWNTVTGKGAFSKLPPGAHRPYISAWVSTIELGAPYTFCKNWIFTPYIQFNLSANNPNSTAILPPFNISKLTTQNTLFALRTAYTF